MADTVRGVGPDGALTILRSARSKIRVTSNHTRKNVNFHLRKETEDRENENY